MMKKFEATDEGVPTEDPVRHSIRQYKKARRGKRKLILVL